jgi:predicted transcriptional regulator
MAVAISNLPVANYMTPYPISVDPDVTFSTVVNFMAERGFGNLIVSKGVIPEGILTEQEILSAIAQGKITSNLKVKDMGFQPFVKIYLGNTIFDAAYEMIKEKQRPLVFGDKDKLVGIITASDMLRAFRKTSNAPSIEGVTTSNIIQCKYEDSILHAVKTMHEKRIGSLIVDKNGKYGIFSERDLLVKVLAKNVDLTAEVGAYSSFPLVVAKQDIKANEAASIMASNNIKRLGLVDSSDALVGIVTARDIVDAYQSEFSKLNPK